MTQELSYSAQLLQAQMQCLELQLAAWSWDNGDPPWVKRDADGKFGSGAGGTKSSDRATGIGTDVPGEVASFSGMGASVQKNLSTGFKEIFGKDYPEIYDALQTGITQWGQASVDFFKDEYQKAKTGSQNANAFFGGKLQDAKTAATTKVSDLKNNPPTKERWVRIGLITGAIAGALALAMVSRKYRGDKATKQLQQGIEALKTELQQIESQMGAVKADRNAATFEINLGKIRTQFEGFKASEAVEATVKAEMAKMARIKAPLLDSQANALKAIKKDLLVTSKLALKSRQDEVSRAVKMLDEEATKLASYTEEAQLSYLTRLEELAKQDGFEEAYANVREDMEKLAEEFPDTMDKTSIFQKDYKASRDVLSSDSTGEWVDEAARRQHEADNWFEKADQEIADEAAKNARAQAEQYDMGADIVRKAKEASREAADEIDLFDELDANTVSQAEEMARIDELKTLNINEKSPQEMIGAFLDDQAAKKVLYDQHDREPIERLISMIETSPHAEVVHAAMKKFNRLATAHLNDVEEASAVARKGETEIIRQIEQAASSTIGGQEIKEYKGKVMKRVVDDLKKLFSDAKVEGFDPEKLIADTSSTGSLISYPQSAITPEAASRLAKVKLPKKLADESHPLLKDAYDQLQKLTKVHSLQNEIDAKASILDEFADSARMQGIPAYSSLPPGTITTPGYDIADIPGAQRVRTNPNNIQEMVNKRFVGEMGDLQKKQGSLKRQIQQKQAQHEIGKVGSALGSGILGLAAIAGMRSARAQSKKEASR